MTKEYLKERIDRIMRTDEAIELSRNGKSITIEDDYDGGDGRIWVYFDNDVENAYYFEYCNPCECLSVAKVTNYVWKKCGERISEI